MRQFFGWRFWGACAALALIAVGVFLLTRDDGDGGRVTGGSEERRRIDLASFVYAAEQDRFRMVDGYSRGYLKLVLDKERALNVAPGTPGRVRCDRLDEIGGCGVVADLLGDAVVWFTILPLGPRLTLELPPIEALEDGYAVLSNGWELRYAPVIDRRCDKETGSFQEFLSEYGRRSTTIVDPGENRVSAVTC